MATAILNPASENDCVEIPTVTSLAEIVAANAREEDINHDVDPEAQSPLESVSISEQIRSGVIVCHLFEQSDSMDAAIRRSLRSKFRELRRQGLERSSQNRITKFLMKK